MPLNARDSLNKVFAGQTVSAIRAIAFYLPQFHPIPENDAWWGPGFTEWTNVVRAASRFKGHYQPYLPTNVGFYDLRVAEVREAQAQLAREYGMHGFCYYHYWFNGKRLLQRPVDEIVASGKPNFPFCLCWANEPWSRRWLGTEQEVLMPQSYSVGDAINHANSVAKIFADPRYIKVQDRPIFVIYRPTHIPQLCEYLSDFSAEVERLGLPNPYLVAINNHNQSLNYRDKGFSAEMQFEPALGALPGFMGDGFSVPRLSRNLVQGVPNGRLKIYSYRESRKKMRETRSPSSDIPCIFVSWDNTPRRGANGIVFHDCSPSVFESELRDELDQWAIRKKDSNLFFINGWNEWAEGNVLEPSERFGLGYLDAVRRCLTPYLGT